MLNIEDFKLTDERLDKLAENCRFFIDQYLEDGDSESIMPQVLVEARGPNDAESSMEISALAVGFNTSIEKNAALHGVGARLYERQRVPLAAFLISEAWSSRQDKAKPRQYLLPEDDPQRVEIAMYMGLSLDGRARHGSRPLRRDAKNLLSAGGGWQVSPAGVTSPLLGQVFRGFISQLPVHMSDEFLRR